MYDHYIAIDWSQKTAVIASFSAKSGETKTFEVDAELKVLRAFLYHLRGAKILTFEEGNSAQWLYVELRDLVDELIVCDPYRNHLLKDGAKNDKNDALKLLQLLRAGLLKNVFHTNDNLIYMRFLAKGYENLIKAGVAIKNQTKAILHSRAPDKDLFHQFVLKGLKLRVDLYEQEKMRYKTEFRRLGEKDRSVRELLSVPGIGIVGAIIIASRVVDAQRFCDKAHFLSYCGLIKLEKTSGGKSYGRKMPRHSTQLRRVFKTAAMSVINGPDSMLKKYYLDKISNGRADFQARHALARRIAVLAFGALKADEVFDVRKISA